jgi:hypothetical protein
MSEIKITGMITHCLPLQEGVSARTGNPWKKQGYVLQHESGQYPRSLRFDVMGEERLQNFALRQGETVTVSLDIDAHEYNGNWYNDITAWRVERTQAPSVPSQPAPLPPVAVYPQAQQDAVTAQPTSSEQDLPF